MAPETPGPRRAADTRTIGVAIAIPPPHGPELQRWRASFGDPMAAAIPTHITLLPPTEVSAAALDAIEEHLGRIARAAAPFTIRLRGTATFRPVSAVVFVALAEGIGDCERLQAQVVAGPLARRLEFPYHPHVTVAHHLPAEALDRAFKELADYSADVAVYGFSLYEHGEDGVWRPQRVFSFGTGAHGPRRAGDASGSS